MVLKKFYINCIVRVLLLSATLCLLAYLIFKTDFIAAAIFLCLMAAYQIYALLRCVTKTNRDLNRFLLTIKHSDFSQSFTNSVKGSGFDELNAAFSAVTREFQRAKIEKEEHFRFLQTIIDHVGIALVAFDIEGNVELMNNAAKRLLKISRLGNIRDLGSISPPLADKLVNISPGDKDLVKLQQDDDLLQLSIYATGFIMRQQKLTLVAMQNIQHELEEKEIIDDVRNAVNTIEKRSNGLLNFIENYRKLTRIPKPDFKVTHIKDLFDRVEYLLKDQFEQSAVNFKKRIDPESLTITADPALIEQVLINLCKNSMEAVNGLVNPKIKLKAGTDGRGNPVIKVSDNGKGIPEEAVEKIFIPFFTTKPQGSGIGLSLSRQIIRLHKATIGVTSKPNEQTVFKLRF
jgi:two-component system nitrogen regulation sensor histidine kinase NtrY